MLEIICFIYGMELRHIRYFLAVAEEGHFTRAAAKLGIGQPPLSMQIKDLEREIGEALFYRAPHGAELTAAGQAFRDAVAPIPDQIGRAMQAARRAARGETGCLRLGFTGTAALNRIVPAAIREFRRSYPDAELILTETNSIALAESLLDRRLDVAILRPSPADPQTLQEYVLAREELVAVLPASHDAARDPGPIDLAQMRDTPLILTPRAIGFSLHDAAIDACRAAGFEPQLGPSAPQIASIISLVSAELGFSLAPDSMADFSGAGVIFRPLRGQSAQVALAVAFLKQRPSPLTENFVAAARAAVRNEGF